MAEIDINIECLPEPILEEIFHYIPDVKQIRLVSKHFKYIVDNSSKLLANYQIKANEIDNVDFEINSFYKSLVIRDLEQLDLENIFGNKLAKHLQSLRMSITEYELISSFSLLESALFSSYNLQEISIRFGYSSQTNVHAIKRPEFPALRNLAIQNAESAIIFLFTDSPKLKKFTTDIINPVLLNDEIVWKLDELKLTPINSSNNPSIIQFIKNQSSLKRLEIHEENILDGIIGELSDLEELHLLRIESRNDDFDDEKLMIPNDNLKILSIVSSNINSQLMKKILMHYRSIEKLYIYTEYDMDFTNLVLSNLCHITVSCVCASLLWRLKMENLKSLTFIGDALTLDIVEMIPAENLRYVEKLKLPNKFIEDILTFIEHFPALKHLHFITEDMRMTKTALNGILAATSLRSIHLMESCWKVDKNPLEYLSDAGNAELIIKLYSMYIQNDFLFDHYLPGFSNMTNNVENIINNCCLDRIDSENDWFSDLEELNFSTDNSDSSYDYFDDL